MFTVSFLIALFYTPAFAYLDPGTGSAILQGLIAAVAAAAVALKLYWHRLLRIIGLKKSKPVNKEALSDNNKTSNFQNIEKK